MSGHTPAPWKFGKCLSMRSYEWVVAYDTDKGRGVHVALVDSGSANASLIAAAPFRVARRYFAGQRAGLQVVRALPDGALFVDVVDSQGRQLAAWKPCATGRYTGTHEAVPRFTEWVPA